MLIWFAVVSVVVVAEVFRSPLVDYRLVAVGSILPLLDVVIGRPTPLHALVAPVVVMAVVMASTAGRRLLRRRLLGIPIGMFLHLVLDGSWDRAPLFWWPVFGASLAGESLPEARGVAFRLVLELMGVAAAFVGFRRYGLAEAGNRRLLARSGHLNRAVLR
ncbi:MAG: hypothetical protein OES24_22895 [Acidimicrobiia bacterium]|nr:hypothetical protein [Acidimicrobiia bacterium]